MGPGALTRLDSDSGALGPCTTQRTDITLTFFAILLGTLAAGIGSVWLAALLSFGALGRYTQHMLSLAAGALMATALMHLLPEAFESGIEPHDLFLTLLLGLVFFFLLDKAELWHHGHEHHHASESGVDAHVHAMDSPPPGKPGGSWAVLAGDPDLIQGRPRGIDGGDQGPRPDF